MNTVRLGVDRVLADLALVPGERWGLVTNYTGTTAGLDLSSVALHRAGGPLQALLTPEHGLQGTAQAGESEASRPDPRTGLPVLDTYRLSGEALDRAITGLDVDVLVVDLQDIGARFYTYVWTMVDCQRSAARLGLPLVVLDRPNPLGGLAVQGPGLHPEFSSFVGRIDIPVRHGLTIGELARVSAALDRAAGLDVPDPHVVTLNGWRRSMTWQETGLPWVMPSPNMPTPQTALAFIGTALFEGTNLSEGRGTTRPFELVGAPWLDHGWADELNRHELPGVVFRATNFVPIFSKHAGQQVGGVQVHVMDEWAFDPLLTGVTMLATARAQDPEHFGWLEPQWEDGRCGRHFIDLLWGSDQLRRRVDDGDLGGLREQLAQGSGLRERDSAWLLYEEDGR